MKLISGAGGGGGGKGAGGSAHTPVEAANTLRTRQYARVIDAICEGEIEGLATGDLQSVYLNKTPIKNADGTYNFSGVTFDMRNGTQAQSYMAGFGGVEVEQSVNTQVTTTTPVTRTITAPTRTRFRVTIGIPALYAVNSSTGDTTGTSVRFQIYLRSVQGSFALIDDITLNDKCMSRAKLSYEYPLQGNAPWNIRIVRVTADSTTSNLQNETWFDTFTEIEEEKLRYPNTCVAGLEISAEQFQSIPVRAYDMKLLRIQVPVNYDPVARTYSGVWNGTFKIAWSNNPAWVFYDLLTNTRYGLGDFIATANVDKWSLYSIAQYCDELVSDGFGGYEPRFTCNLYIQERKEAFQVLQDLASVFRGMPFWSLGQVTATQDRPSDPVALYTTANVKDGKFVYSGSSLKTRHTVAIVTWNDPDDFYTQKKEYVENTDAISRYGLITTEIVAVGCTSRGQANRVGRWILYAEANETETVSFIAGIDSLACRPGQIIKVQDQFRAGTRKGGRIASATSSTIVVDSTFDTTGVVGGTASVIMPDGSVAKRTITNVSGTTITFSSSFPYTPLPDAIWVVDTAQVSAQLFRVVAVLENNSEYEITALAHNPSKYDYVEKGLALSTSTISVLSDPPPAPTNLVVRESLYETGGSVAVLVELHFDPAERAVKYVVLYSRDNGTDSNSIEVTAPLCEIRNAEAGNYSFSVYAVGANGKASTIAKKDVTIFGKTLLPNDVQNFSHGAITNGYATFTWDKTVDLDVQVGGSVRLRYSPLTSGALWEYAVDIGTAVAGNSTQTSLALLTGTYFAKFVDSSGNQSVNAAQIVSNLGNVLTFNAIATITESPTFSGTLNGTFKTTYGANSGISISGGSLISSVPSIAALKSIAYAGGVAASGEYLFSGSKFDLGATYTSILTANLEAVSFDYAEATIAQRGLVSTWPSIVGGKVDDVNATLYVRTTNDDPNGVSPVWSPWKPFFKGNYTARGFDFKVLLTSQTVTHNILLKTLGVTIDMPDRVEAQSNLTSGAGTYVVTFPNAFRAKPAIGINFYGGATGDYYVITAESATGFSITFYNASNTVVSRRFDYMAKGYGYKT